MRKCKEPLANDIEQGEITLHKEDKGQMLTSNENHWLDDKEQRTTMKEQRITTKGKE